MTDAKRLTKILNARADALLLLTVLGVHSDTCSQLKLGALKIRYSRGSSLPDALNIWTPAGKVMSIEWRDDRSDAPEELTIISFKSGAWVGILEDHLVHHVFTTAASPSACVN